MIVRCLTLAALIALSACKGSDDTALKEKAEGEILPGSVSDAMLPLDTVRSEPPLAPYSEAAGGKRRAASDDEDEASEPADAGSDAAPASPAATPDAAAT